MDADGLVDQIITSLKAQSFMVPSRRWLRALVTARTSTPPLVSLVATAKARLLAADLTTPGLVDAQYAARHGFSALVAAVAGIGSNTAGRKRRREDGDDDGGGGGGANTSNRTAVAEAAKHMRETSLADDLVVQVLEVEDLTRSRWEQAEDLEAVARGEQTRGREVIRLPAGGDHAGEGAAPVDVGSSAATQNMATQQPVTSTAAAAAGKNSTHRLIFQDCQGQKMYGLELRRIDRIGVGKTNIGEKWCLRKGSKVARGVVLVEPDNCVFLGGKVDVWQKAWLEGRLASLKGMIEVSNGQA